MPRCRYCGFEIPDEEEARFCPNCGAPITYIQVKPTRVRIKIPILRRVGIAILFFALSFATTLLGSLSNISLSEAQSIMEDIEGFRKILDTQSLGTALIFGNNFIHCLIMFIPILGPLYGFYVLYNTGRVIAAIGIISGNNPVSLMLALFILPHALIEYIAYSLAMSESLWFTYMAIKHNLREELNNACKLIVLSAALLLLAAFIEVALISLLSQFSSG